MFKSTPADSNATHKLSSSSWLWNIGIAIGLVFATFVINYKMIKDGLNGMPDIRWHITWVQHFSRQLAEGIWYPRWLAGTNFGYGSPTFVFYPPLAYYLGSAFKAIGLNTQQAITAIFSFSLWCCGFNFYLYGKRHWGRLAAVVGALALMTTPFVAHNIYFAARMAEIFALLWVPLGLWLTDKALEQYKWRIVLALFFALFALSHVPTLLLCFIFWVPYTLAQLFKKPWQAVVTTIGAAFLGFGLVSFYLLPAILEQKFVNTEGLKAVLGGFRANLVGTPLTINSVFTGRIEKIFFSQLLAIAIFAALGCFLQRREANKLKQTWGWIAFVVVVALMMSYVSLPIWQASRTLQMVQFPWRIMGLFSLGLGALCSLACNGALKQRLPIKAVFAVVLVGILSWNFHYGYKLSRSLPTINNPGRGKVANLEHLKIALNEPYTDKLIDVRPYRPLINGGFAAPDPIIGQPPVTVVDGEAKVKIDHWGSYERQLQVAVTEPATVRIRTYYYPGWHLFVAGKPQEIKVPADGTMTLQLPAGSHTVQLRYQWTKAFSVGIILSLVSVLILLIAATKPVWFNYISPS